jgi:FkbM family methyltransferase
MGQNSIQRRAVRQLGRVAPSVLRFLAHRNRINDWRWPLLEELMADPKGRQWLASLENPTKTRNGFKIFTLPNDLTSDFIKLHGLHEPGTEQFVLDHLKPASTFLDVGANIGYFSMVAAITGKSKVVAFEPQQPLAELLHRSVAYNQVASLVKVEQLALSNSPATMSITSCPGNSGHAQLTTSAGDGVQPYSVSVVVFDEWMKSNPIARVSVCKIDTEGAELQVLNGMMKMLERDRPAIVIEIIDAFLAKFGASEPAVWDFLRGLGYRDISKRYTSRGDSNRYLASETG